MAENYVGRSPAFGLLEVQTFVGDDTEDTFTLDFKVNSSSSILMVKNGLVLKPDVDYNVSAGDVLQFTTAPLVADNVFCIYLGKQITSL